MRHKTLDIRESRHRRYILFQYARKKTTCIGNDIPSAAVVDERRMSGPDIER